MILHYVVDLDAPLTTQTAVTLIQEGDRAAHILQIELMQGGKPFRTNSLNVSGYFGRADGVRVALAGLTSEGMVSVELPDDCYIVPGIYAALIRIGEGHTQRTVLRIAGRVEGEGSGPVVDPGHTIPTPAEYKAQMEAMARALEEAVRVTDVASGAADAANTAAVSANEAAGEAVDAAAAANTAARSAETQAGAAQSAAQEAGKQAGEAQTAANAANEAAGQAEKAAQAANEAAGKANKAVTDIAAAKTDAEQAVQDAQTAVETAEAWSGATATAETIPHGQTPTVTVTDGPEGKELHFQVPEGKPGAKASFDDNVISGEKGWSSEQIVKYGAENYFSPFYKKSGIVQGNLVPTYPLHIISHIMPIQEGSGDPSPTNVREIVVHKALNLAVCGKNVLRVRAVSSSKNGLTYTVGKDGSIHVKGTATKREPFYFNTGGIPIDGKTVYAYGVPIGGSPDAAFIEAKVTMKDGSSEYPQIKANPSTWGELSQIVRINDLYILVNAGATVDVVFKPMIVLDSRDDEYEPYSGQSFSQAFQDEEVYGGIYDWNSGIFRPAYKMLERRISDMNSGENYPGWIFSDKSIRMVVGENINDRAYGAVINCAKYIAVNTTGPNKDDVWFAGGQGLPETMTEWKSKYPDLTVQILLPYREDLRPTIQLIPHLIFPQKSGVTTIYGNSDKVEVWGRLDPNSEKSVVNTRIANLETQTSTLEAAYREGVNQA